MVAHSSMETAPATRADRGGLPPSQSATPRRVNNWKYAMLSPAASSASIFTRKAALAK